MRSPVTHGDLPGTDRIRDRVVGLTPTVMLATTAMLTFNWGVQGIRTPSIFTDHYRFVAVILVLVALCPVAYARGARGDIRGVGWVAVAFTGVFAISSAIATARLGYGESFALAYCGLLGLAAILIWPTSAHFVVGTVLALVPPLLSVQFAVDDAGVRVRSCLFAVNCLALCVGLHLFVRRFDLREAQRDRDLIHEASHDALTGLPNRRSWTRAAGASLAASRRAGTPFALVLIDVDRFKQLNDTYGHEAGDRALISLAGGLLTAMQGGGYRAVPGRLGGDEFVLAVAGAERAAVEVLCARVRSCLALAPGPTGTVTLSVGMAMLEAGEDAALGDLLARADQAMYQGKREASPDTGPAEIRAPVSALPIDGADETALASAG